MLYLNNNLCFLQRLSVLVNHWHLRTYRHFSMLRLMHVKTLNHLAMPPTHVSTHKRKS